jgi:outer membrane protein assembly factor BamE (lipoprotein component of BamABCDE complex)
MGLKNLSIFRFCVTVIRTPRFGGEAVAYVQALRLKAIANLEYRVFLTPLPPAPLVVVSLTTGKIHMRKILIISLFALLTACVSTGVKVDPTKLTNFQKGKTTYSEVVAKLGNPTQTATHDNGTKTAIYAYMSSQPRPESFIPYVGLMVGGADVETSSVNLNFDKHDILTGIESTQGTMGAGTGFEANSQPRNSNQPSIVK